MSFCPCIYAGCVCLSLCPHTPHECLVHRVNREEERDEERWGGGGRESRNKLQSWPIFSLPDNSAAQMFLHPVFLKTSAVISSHNTKLYGYLRLCLYTYAVHQKVVLVFVWHALLQVCGRICTDLFLCLKQHLTDLVSTYASECGHRYVPVNNLHLVGQLLSAVQILNLMMQASAEQ